MFNRKQRFIRPAILATAAAGCLAIGTTAEASLVLPADTTQGNWKFVPTGDTTGSVGATDSDTGESATLTIATIDEPTGGGFDWQNGGAELSMYDGSSAINFGETADGQGASFTFDKAWQPERIWFLNWRDWDEVTISVSGDVKLVDNTSTKTEMEGDGLDLTFLGTLNAGDTLEVISSDTDRNEANNVGFRINDLQASIVPEPASLALLGVGGLAMLARRRDRTAA